MILVVEDYPDLRALILKVLGAQGYTTLSAENGEDALASVHTHHPSLVILDVGLPDVDGLQLLRIMREREETKRLPVIVFSAHGRAQEAADAGATAFLQKGSVDMSLLIARVEEFLPYGRTVWQ